MGKPFRIYNTLSRSTEDFEPIHAGKVGLYVCGMTVYDHAHVGHARAMVVFDMVTRYLRHRGWEVKLVRNFTDVDDKIIVRAQEKGVEPLDLAAGFIEDFGRDVRDLGLLVPDSEPKVSESIKDIVDMIGRLIENGHAYPNEGSVWFSVQSFPEYGKLSGQKVDEVRSAETQAGKKHPADFALWKAEKPGEPAWESPWGRGRPGWHIECSAMAFKELGTEVDIHGGGLDLVFPHHENEIAQSECGNSHAPFARYWMHNGMLTMGEGGQKMGKSLGNVFNIRDALQVFPAEALRIYYIQAHYRSPLPWGPDALTDALGQLARLYEAKEVALSMGGEEKPEQLAKSMGGDAQALLDLAERFEERFYGAMDEDFNTAKAMGVIFELVRAVNRFANHKKAKKRGGPLAKKALACFERVHQALNLLGMDVEAFQEEVKAKRLSAMGLEKEVIEAKLAARVQARQDKDWAKADALRAELEADGIVVMDQADGVTWRIRL